MFRNLKRSLFLATVALSAAAIYEQLKRPPEDRTWRGTILGVPYDFRPPSPGRFLDAWWNPDSDRLFLPRDFGVGWAINFHVLYRLLRDRDAPGTSVEGRELEP